MFIKTVNTYYLSSQHLLASLCQIFGLTKKYSDPMCDQDEGYEEGSYRSLLTDLLDSNAASSKPELARRMEELALPVVSKLADAATKLIQ